MICMFHRIYRIGGNRFHRGENYPPWFFPLDTTPNITSPPSTESSAVESHPSHHEHKHKKKGFGPGGIASIVCGVTLLAACAAFFAVARIQQRGRSLRRLESSPGSWQSLPVSTARGEIDISSSCRFSCFKGLQQHITNLSNYLCCFKSSLPLLQRKAQNYQLLVLHL